MAAPLVGKRVIVNGIAGRAELNGRSGVVESFADDTGKHRCCGGRSNAVLTCDIFAVLNTSFLPPQAPTDHAPPTALISPGRYVVQLDVRPDLQEVGYGPKVALRPHNVSCKLSFLFCTHVHELASHHRRSEAQAGRATLHEMECGAGQGSLAGKHHMALRKVYRRLAKIGGISCQCH